MPDRDQDRLEQELRELGSRIEYPPTPDVSGAVRRRLEEGAVGHRRGRTRAPAVTGWAAVAAAILLISSAALWAATRPMGSDYSVSPGAGGGAGAAAEGGGARESSPTEQAAEATGGGDLAASGGAASGSSAVPVSGATLGLGERLSAPAARERVGRLLLPEAPELAGEPREIYAGGPSPSDGVVVVFGPDAALPPLGDSGVGLLLAESPGDPEPASLPAAPGSGGSHEEVDVGGERAYWFPDGRALERQPGRAEDLPGGALVWRRGDAALLLRADVAKDEAVRIAESLS